MMLKRRKRETFKAREPEIIRSPSHLQYCRGFDCAILGRADHECEGKIEAAHTRVGTDGGTSLKPSDCWVVPLCAKAHAEQHRIGERSFETKYQIQMKAIAQECWAKSPHRIRYEKKQQEKSA